MHVSGSIQQASLGLENARHGFEGIQYPQGVEPDADVNCGASLFHRANCTLGDTQALRKDSHGVVTLEASASKAPAQLSQYLCGFLNLLHKTGRVPFSRVNRQFKRG